ncbi:MAG: hypothetical protein ACR2MS_07700 [Weeksellaceae bacterium]
MSDQIKKDLDKIMRDVLYGLPIYKPLYASEFYLFDRSKTLIPALEESGLEMLSPNLNRDNFTFLKRSKPKETIYGQVKKGEEFYSSGILYPSMSKQHKAISVSKKEVAVEDAFGNLVVFEQKHCFQHKEFTEPLTPNRFPPGKVFLHSNGNYYMVMSWPNPETCITADVNTKEEGGFKKLLGIEGDSYENEFDAGIPVTPFSIEHHIQE